MAKFKAGDWVIARNGKGAVYLINRIVPADRFNSERYEFDNGSVDIRKRALSGYHEVTRADKGYKLVKNQ